MARPPAPALDWTGLPSRSAPTMAPPPVTQLLPNVQLPTGSRIERLACRQRRAQSVVKGGVAARIGQYDPVGETRCRAFFSGLAGHPRTVFTPQCGSRDGMSTTWNCCAGDESIRLISSR